MIDLHANYSKKGQLKIQQMAFVLVALIIFFSMAALFYFSIRYSDLREDVETLREQETIETVKKISSTAEFSWSARGDCAACVDLDKLFILKDRESYEGFWKNIAFLEVTRIHPNYGGIECNKQNYPECDTINLVDEESSLRGEKAFVALCRYDDAKESNICEMGKVVMAFETIN